MLRERANGETFVSATMCSQQCVFVCQGLYARVILAGELGSMSKNNLRGITLVREPIWGIYSLTLIITWFTQCLCQPRFIDKYATDTKVVS